MPPQTQSQNLELQLHRTLNATPQRIFDAWTDPKQMEAMVPPFRPVPNAAHRSGPAHGRALADPNAKSRRGIAHRRRCF